VFGTPEFTPESIGMCQTEQGTMPMLVYKN